jgi:hypothetical protein
MAPENPQHTVEASVMAKRLVGGILVTETKTVFNTKRVVYTIRVPNTCVLILKDLLYWIN